MSKNREFSDTSANRYSLALYELASEAGVTTKVEENSNSFLELISNSKDFRNLIKDPTLSQEILKNVINKLSENFNLETLFITLASEASSYKAKEYLLADVSENPLFLLNLLPLNVYD